MRISVITVCYNSGKTIESTIQSVIAQSFQDVEYIVIDGGSTDNSLAIIEKYRDKIHYFISEPDSGIYDAMNKGISQATGDVVGILNSDDVYKNNDVLRKISTSFSTNVECVCTDVEIFRDNPANVIRYYSCTRWKPWMFHIGHQPPHPGFFVRKECYDHYGKFNTELKLAADFELLLRFIKTKKAKTIFMPWVSISMRSGGASQRSFSNIRKANSEVNRALKMNGYFSSEIFIWSKYLLKIFQFGKG